MDFIDGILQEVSEIREEIRKFEAARKKDLQACEKKYVQDKKGLDDELNNKKSKIRSLKSKTTRLRKDLDTIYLLIGIIEYHDSLKEDLSKLGVNQDFLKNELDKICQEAGFQCSSYQISDLQNAFDTKIEQVKSNEKERITLEQEVAQLIAQQETLLHTKEQQVTQIQTQSVNESIDNLVQNLSSYGRRVNSLLGTNNYASLNDYPIMKSGTFPLKVQVSTSLISNVNFSTMVFSNDLPYLEIPFSLDLRNKGSLFLNVDASVKLQEVEKYMMSFLLSFMSSIPLDHLSFGFYSPYSNVMPNMDAFMNASLRNGLSIQDEIFQSSIKFSSLLDIIHRRADQVSMDLYESKYGDYLELNAMGNSKDKAQVIFIHDFLSDISEKELLQLLNYVNGYRRCGVYFILVDSINSDKLKKRSKEFLSYVDDLMKYCEAFSLSANALEYMVHPKLDYRKIDKISLKADETMQMNSLNKALDNMTPQNVYDFCMSISKKI